MDRRDFLRLTGFAAVGVSLAVPALAHHGWGWASDEEYEITGKVLTLRLGNPHGEVDLDVDGETWTAEVGQPWRNDRVGLTEEMMAKGTEMTVHGHRHPEKPLIKAERVVIAGKDYNLYPNRDS